MDWEFGVSRCKLLHLEWINNKVLLYSTGNYIQSPGINHRGKEYEKKNVYMCKNYTYLLNRLSRNRIEIARGLLILLWERRLLTMDMQGLDLGHTVEVEWAELADCMWEVREK